MAKKVDDHVTVCIEHTVLHPPVTVSSLRKFQFGTIVDDPKARHDLNFIRSEHLRLRYAGYKDKSKLSGIEKFWAALRDEIASYGNVSSSSITTPTTPLIHLPGVLMTIRDILITLVRPCYHHLIREKLEADHVIQGVMHGVCNVPGLGSWLGDILRRHCAPMRDSIVDEMEDKIRRGAAEADGIKLTDGIRQLLDLLQTMTIDAAIHGLRQEQPQLIDESIGFQRRYNAGRDTNTIVASSRAWLRQQTSTMPHHPSSGVEIIARSLTKSISEAAPTWPSAFQLDHDRLQTLCEKMRALISRDICVKILRETALNKRKDAQSDDTELATLDKVNLRDTITAIELIAGNRGKYYKYHRNIAAQIMCTTLAINGHNSTLDMDVLATVEKRLRQDLSSNSSRFRQAAEATCTQLQSLLRVRLRDNIGISAHDLHVKFSCKSDNLIRSLDLREHLINQIVHISILHWRVWGELYLTDDLAHVSKSEPAFT